MIGKLVYGKSSSNGILEAFCIVVGTHQPVNAAIQPVNAALVNMASFAIFAVPVHWLCGRNSITSRTAVSGCRTHCSQLLQRVHRSPDTGCCGLDLRTSRLLAFCTSCSASGWLLTLGAPNLLCKGCQPWLGRIRFILLRMIYRPRYALRTLPLACYVPWCWRQLGALLARCRTQLSSPAAVE